MCASILPFIFACLLAFVSPNMTSAAPVAFDCEGDACPQVTLVWEDEGQRFRIDNDSDRRVKIEVTTYAGASSIRVEPHKSDYLQVKNFNGAYRADYE